jgi:hypothetical protein
MTSWGKKKEKSPNKSCKLYCPGWSQFFSLLSIQMERMTSTLNMDKHRPTKERASERKWRIFLDIETPPPLSLINSLDFFFAFHSCEPTSRVNVRETREWNFFLLCQIIVEMIAKSESGRQRGKLGDEIIETFVMMGNFTKNEGRASPRFWRLGKKSCWTHIFGMTNWANIYWMFILGHRKMQFIRSFPPGRFGWMEQGRPISHEENFDRLWP